MTLNPHLGAPQPLQALVALDGVDEFLSTCNSTTAAWPHEPAAIDYYTSEGSCWRLSLSPDGARAAVLPAPAPGEDPAEPNAFIRGGASELVLAMYGRLPLDALDLGGDRHVIGLLVDWDADE